ncbi:SCO3242 family prenyltransferase [Actinoallomurus iriomotensis]|uniref:Transferase n=1 Tax=Actinoallomurus iriomotensis TaxID=478107 RepID=A0A9W6VKT6_9ACTN|nr:UbiA family prenyltransferase [Actinoallomurus iriomotensis]GLY75653.1 transferase [Actinoallomurus iriomotensis]GLY85292.1 transferase [Actinoallomurus iriomotensis]
MTDAGGPLPSPRAVAELVRAPAALTVPGDTLAGAAAAGWPFGAATPVLALSSTLLYWAGMALNDYADRDLDAVERPERPIPSGRVRPGFALGLSAGLTAAAIGAAGLAGGRRALGVAVPLAATVWAYDLALKATPAGPAAMAAARALDVLLGAGTGRLRDALPPAALVGTHTLAVTALSRREVTGGGPVLPATTLAATGAVALSAAAWPVPRRGQGRAARLLRQAAGAGLLGSYLSTAGRAQLAAVADPGADRIRRAVGAGILGLIPLQASLAARRGALPAAAAVAAGFPLARRLSRKVSPT